MTNIEIGAVLTPSFNKQRNQKGEKYPPKTLYKLITSLQKPLEINNVKRSLVDAKNFPLIYYALEVMMKDTTSLGLGMDHKVADIIDLSQEEILW